MQRNDGRGCDEIRSINFELNIAPHANGSVLVSIGQTRVICGVTIEEAVPRWMKEQGVTGGWLTAEYSMLPYSTQTRKPRDVAKGRLDGRSVEIQRLIGRSLRAVVDLEKLGPRHDAGSIAMSCRPMVERARPQSPEPVLRWLLPAGNLCGIKSSMPLRWENWSPQ